jgi:hypothetical protein
MPMIKPKLALLQMQSKSMFSHAIELSQAALSKAPKGLNPIDMAATSYKLILSMVDPKVFIKANVDQTIIATPAIGVDDAQRISFASDNCLQGSFGRIRNNLRVNLIASLKQPKDNRFTSCTTASFAPHSAWTKVRLISLQLATQRRSLQTPPSHTGTYAKVDTVDASHRNSAQSRALGSRQIQGKMFNNLTKFGFAKFGTVEIPIFVNHFKKLACIEYMFAS